MAKHFPKNHLFMDDFKGELSKNICRRQHFDTKSLFIFFFFILFFFFFFFFFYFIFFFFRKIRFDVLYESQVINIKCQALFSVKNNSKFKKKKKKKKS